MLAASAATAVFAVPTALKGAGLLGDVMPGELSLPAPPAAVDAAVLPASVAASGVRLEKAPVANMSKVPARTADVVWGDWYEFSTGTLASSSAVMIEQFFGVTLPKKVSLMRRDAVDDEETAQLKLSGLLGDTDLIVDWNPKTLEYSWDRLDLPDVENIYSEITPWIYPHTGTFSPKQVWSLPLFMVVIHPELGFNLPVTFTPDVLPDSRFDISFAADSPNSTSASAVIDAVGTDIATVKYGVFYTGGGSVVIDNMYVPLANVIDSDMPGFDITAVALSETRTISENFTLDKTGTWVFYACFYDADGDIIRSGGRLIAVGLREPGKWRSAGMADFTDAQYSEGVESLARYDMVEVVEYPSWYTAPRTWQVPLEESVETPGLYRLVNPYTCETCPWRDSSFKYKFGDELNTVDYVFDRSGENDYYYVFDVRNPEVPWAYVTPTGVNSDNFTYASGISEYNQSLATPTACPLNYDPEGRVYIIDSTFEVRLPGYRDYTIEAVKEYTGIVLSHVGEGVAEIRYTLLTGEQLAALEQTPAELLAANRTDLITIGTATAAGALSLDAFGLVPESEYYLYAVTVDAAGTVRKEYDLEMFVMQKHNYTFYDTARMREGVVEYLFGGENRFYDVEIYTADDAPGKFFVKNPYRRHLLFGSYVTYSRDCFLEIDCSDPSRVRMPQFDTHLNIGYGDISIAATASVFEMMGNTPDEIAAYGWYGTFENHEITFPVRGVAICAPLIFDTENWQYGNTEGLFSIRFSGYKDYTLGLTQEFNGVSVSEVGADVAAIRYSVAEAGSTNEEVLADAIKSGIVTTMDAEPIAGALDLSDFAIEPFTRYMVVAVTMDAGGNFCKSASVEFYAEPEYTYSGEGILTDAFMQIFSDYTEEHLVPRSVEVYTVEQTPGVVYVKEPHPDLAHLGYLASRYMPISISDPDRVYIPGRSYGFPVFDNSSTPGYFQTYSEVLRSHGWADDNIAAEGYFGTLRDGKVVIPYTAISIEDYMFVPAEGANYNAALELQLPPSITGVESVEVDNDAQNAPAEYFDLGGRRVLNPSTGIYIVRRGSSVTKEAVR